jgi:hypothetical protein
MPIPWLKRLLKALAAPPQRPAPLTYAIRCGRCGATVEVRVFPDRELSATYAADGPAFILRKVVVDGTCFTRMELTLEFDARRREISRQVAGGQFVPPPGDA